jgi:hypothetical protein
MTEEDFILGLRNYLQDIATSRIEHVLQWLKVNTERFGEKAEITVLFRSFDTCAKELRQSVTICGSKCSSCGLLCLEHKQHEGDHHCNTSHECPHICSFTDQHIRTDIPACGISYVLLIYSALILILSQGWSCWPTCVRCQVHYVAALYTQAL